MNETVVVGYARTAVGTLGGGLSPLAATDLGGKAIAAALERAGVPADQVECTVMGHALQAATGQATARQAAVNAGIPLEVPAETMNKVCLSGTSAIARGSSLIALGEYDKAFASVAMAAVDDLGLDEDVVNVNGGAVAMGHPLGCSGARITVTLVNELRRRGGGIGASALCGGGGQGDALILEVA